jgi:hypothetical protein
MLSCNEKRAEKHSVTHSPGCFCHKPVIVSLFVLLLLLLLLLLLVLLLLLAAVSFFGGERGRSMLIEMRVF